MSGSPSGAVLGVEGRRGVFDRLTKCFGWNKEVVYLARSIPMDGKMNALASLQARAKGSPTDPGLVAALAAKNVVRNQKYRKSTFVLQVLYEQFRFFFNLYFLAVAMSQFIPAFQVGFLFTYIAPLVFVLGVTLIKEGYDDYKRYVRDREANSQVRVAYVCLDFCRQDYMCLSTCAITTGGALPPRHVFCTRCAEAAGALPNSDTAASPRQETWRAYQAQTSA